MSLPLRLVVLILSLVFAGGAIAQVQAIYQYRVDSATPHVLQNALGGDESKANDINDNGAIVGWARTPSGTKHAFFYIGGTTTDIGALFGQGASWANGVNNSNEVVGNIWDRAFYWHTSSGVFELGNNVHPGEGIDDAYETAAFAINAYGRIVGRAYGDGPESPIPYDDCYYEIPVQWAYAYASPEVVYCPEEPWGNNYAYDVSNSGWIVGGEVGYIQRAFRFKNGVLEYVPPPSSASPEIWGRGVNEEGSVVGYAFHNTGNKAFIWNGESSNSKYLGTLPGGDRSEAYEVNNDRFVAGYSNRPVYTSGFFAPRNRAFLWHADFGMYELPLPSGFPASTTHCLATSLNNRKRSGLIQVVGYCTQSDKAKAVRWNVETSLVVWTPSLP